MMSTFWSANCSADTTSSSNMDLSFFQQPSSSVSSLECSVMAGDADVFGFFDSDQDELVSTAALRAAEDTDEDDEEDEDEAKIE
jgi:hypothetical protein